MSNGDETRSVRVELEAGQSNNADAPLVEGSSSTSRIPKIAGMAAVVLLIAAFLSLRPAGDQAADGTQRVAPTTTIQNQADDAPPSSTTPTPHVDSALFNALEAAQLAESISPLPVAELPERQTADLADTWEVTTDDVLLEDLLRFDVDTAFIDSSGELDLNNSGPAFGECVATAAEQRISGFAISPVESSTSFEFAGDGTPGEIRVLANERVAVVDVGTIGLNASCDAAGGFFRRESGLVIIDASDETVTTYGAPLELRSDFGQGDGVEIIGEFRVDETRSHVFMTSGRSMWSLDTSEGSWTLVNIGSNPYIFSESGNRLYGIVDDHFELIDLGANLDGSVSYSAAISPIRSRITSRLLEDASIIFATNEHFFVSQGSNTWQFSATPSVIDLVVRSEPVETSRRIIQIAETDDGFVGLTDVSPSELPQLMASADGVTWAELDTSLAGRGADGTGPIEWLDFVESSTGLALLGTEDETAAPLDVFVSESGANWQMLQGFPALAEPDSQVAPLAVDDSTVIALELLESVNVSEVSAESACATTEPQDRGTSLDLVFVDTDEGTTQSASIFPVDQTVAPRFFYLDPLRVAATDPGSDAVVLCSDSRLLPARAAAVVIFDGATGQNVRYPVPAELRVDLREEFDNYVLGEVQLVENQVHVIVAISGVLWSIEPVSGRWTALSERIGDLGFQTPLNPQWTSAESANRFYALANESVVIFEIRVNQDGELQATPIVAPIEADEPILSGFGSIMYANDELVFYTDGNTVWRLELPN